MGAMADISDQIKAAQIVDETDLQRLGDTDSGVQQEKKNADVIKEALEADAVLSSAARKKSGSPESPAF